MKKSWLLILGGSFVSGLLVGLFNGVYGLI